LPDKENCLVGQEHNFPVTEKHLKVMPASEIFWLWQENNFIYDFNLDYYIFS
jgi:hypothetical protein